MSVTDILHRALRTGARVQVIPQAAVQLSGAAAGLPDHPGGQHPSTGCRPPWAAWCAGRRWTTRRCRRRCAPSCLRGETMPTPYLNYWRAHYPAALFANLFGSPPRPPISAATTSWTGTLPTTNRCPLAAPATTAVCWSSPRTGGRRSPAPWGELCARGRLSGSGILLQHARQDHRAVLSQPAAAPTTPEIIYRTGDLVRYDEEGAFAVHGPGGQPDQTHGLPHRIGRDRDGRPSGRRGLQSCACLYDAPRDRLVLFYTGKKGLEESLRPRLAQRLPAYMQPTVYRRLQAHAPEPERKNRPRRTGRPVQGGLNHAYYG